MLVGNKNDLNDDRKVSFAEAKQFATDRGMLFQEASAKSGANVYESFHALIQCTFPFGDP